jgi:hypothetical protein
VNRPALSLLLLAIPVGGAPAQVSPAIVPALRDARRVRLELTSRARIEAVFQDLTPTELRVRAIVHPTIHESYFAERRIALDSLSRIWVQDGTHWRTGAYIGAATFGAFGFALAWKFKRDPQFPGCSRDPAGCVLGATIGGAALGAVSGGLMGALLMRWRLVWQL